MIPKRHMITDCRARIRFVRNRQSAVRNQRHRLMLARDRRRVFGDEKSDPETEIPCVVRRPKDGAEDKCRPSRYYSDPVPV
jgi:hypothetical protein